MLHVYWQTKHFCQQNSAGCGDYTLQKDQPVNLVGAFYARDEGYLIVPMQQLEAHSKRVYLNYAGKRLPRLVNREVLSALGNVYPSSMLLDVLAGEIHIGLGNGGDAQ